MRAENLGIANERRTEGVFRANNLVSPALAGALVDQLDCT